MIYLFNQLAGLIIEIVSVIIIQLIIFYYQFYSKVTPNTFQAIAPLWDLD